MFARLVLIMTFISAAGPAGAGIAVTFDDLPLQGGSPPAPAEIAGINRALLKAVTARDIPAVGFVNESKLEVDGEPHPALVAVLEAWLEAGLELGNHTYSHPDLHHVSLPAYLEDIVRGERVTRALAESRGKPYRYFRHPFLHTGRDLSTRDAVRAFLSDRGYTVAPVTIDNSEWIYAAAYEKAHVAGDAAMRQRLGTSYLDYMAAKTDYYDGNARELFGRDIHHVLLLHANRLNADWFGALADRLAAGGQRFVTLEQALSDPAYASEDHWTGQGGISWLHRWALARGVPRSFFAGEPEAPVWVREYAGIANE